MTDRRTFIQTTGVTEAQFSGYQLLKLVAYDVNTTSGLTPGQRLDHFELGDAMREWLIVLRMQLFEFGMEY